MDIKSASRVISVTQLNEYMKMLVESDINLSEVYIRGEISNFTNHYKTGHFYFTLKDETGLLKAVMFRSYTANLRFMPENGMKVIVHGRVAVFVRDGQYQLYADAMEPDGVGALYVAFEQLKAKLAAEGLFDESRKKPLPRFAEKIGIITSPTGAAVRDMINVLGRRSPGTEIKLYGATVQGETAPAQLIAGIEYFNSENDVDLIIIGRGGGSIEDLWAFNDERLARAVAASRIPVISAVGHETDFTICDFAADRRAPTPSAAAEIAVPDREELVRAVRGLSDRMAFSLDRRIKFERDRVEKLKNSRPLTSPLNMIDDKRMAVLSLASRAEAAAKLTESKKRAILAAGAAKLEALNPLSVISRGYSAVYSEDGSVIKSVKQIKTGDLVSLRLADGKASARIEKTGDENE